MHNDDNEQWRSNDGVSNCNGDSIVNFSDGSCNDLSSASQTAVAATSTMSTTVASSATRAAVVEETVTVEMKEEEDKKGKVKGFPLSKQVGVVLERENKFFLGRKEENPKLLGGEVE